TVCARSCRAISAAAPAMSRSSKRCSTPAPPTRRRAHETKRAPRVPRAAQRATKRSVRAAGAGPPGTPCLARSPTSGAPLRCASRCTASGIQVMRPTNLFVGSPVERLEDLRFLRGRGEYVDDLTRDGLLHAAILRSSVAHGRIRAIDAGAARARPGVRAVISAAEIVREIGEVPRIPMRQEPLPALNGYLQPVIAPERG